VKFWDASAIVPLLVDEANTRQVQRLAARDPAMIVWWGTLVECASAVARLERAVALNAGQVAQAHDQLRSLAARWREVEPGELLRENAIRFLRVHPLRVADAFQLAAAFIAAHRQPSSLQVVTLDQRLADAMRKEGFELIEVAAR
jgi:uncharacterized protein